MERLTRLKTDAVNKHKPIYVRINLLKGILNYHKGKRNESRLFLELAQNELKKLRVDDTKIVSLMGMGFNSTEAKLALRATCNDVDSACELILKKRQHVKEIRAQEKEEKYSKKLEYKYGRTWDNKL